MAQQQAQHQKVMEMHEDIYLDKQLSVLKEGHILGQHFSVVRMAATIDLSRARASSSQFGDGSNH